MKTTEEEEASHSPSPAGEGKERGPCWVRTESVKESVGP